MELRIHHIPVCPFSQRVKTLLALKGLSAEVAFNVVDITKPREEWLQELTKGTTAMPVMEVEGKTPIKESMVILRMIEQMFPDPPIARPDPHEHALESLLVAHQDDFGTAGYQMILNQVEEGRSKARDKLLAIYAKMNRTILDYAPGNTFFFDRFGWAELIFTPLFQRFWFLEYYEGFNLPKGPDFDRVARWRAACLEEPFAQQVTYEEIVKLYYDYAKGAGNGALVPGRTRSSFVFDPHWNSRPMPPADKFGRSASDLELGLL